MPSTSHPTRRRASDISHHESRVFAEASIVEDQQELRTIRVITSGLQGMGDTRGEVPQVTGALEGSKDVNHIRRLDKSHWENTYHSRDEIPSFLVDGGDLGATLDHVRPLFSFKKMSKGT